jgi:hypothetical protein
MVEIFRKLLRFKKLYFERKFVKSKIIITLRNRLLFEQL